MNIQGTQKINSRKTSFVQSLQISQIYDVFDEFKKCRTLVNRKLQDAHHNYSVNFFKQCETSKQKWNFINKKLGNQKRY